MKLRLWERPRTAAPPSLTGVSEEPAGDIPAAAPLAAGGGIHHAHSDPATVADNDECCALLRGDSVRGDAPRRRQRRRA